jgi:hypothetical protein
MHTTEHRLLIGETKFKAKNKKKRKRELHTKKLKY